MLKKLITKGFTLAEVLITLTIIGVIAAITIPNLMQSYRKHQVETNLKSAYTILSNALTMAKAEHGSFEEMMAVCKHGTDADQSNCFMNNYLKPYLKYSKMCNQSDASCNNIFLTDYVKKLDGTTSTAAIFRPNSGMATMRLNNGILVGVIWWGWPAPQFLVDINGSNGPNQMGTDNFYFTLRYNESQVATTLRCGESGYDPILYPWTVACSGNGTSCSCPIMYNGWKIPDNYPVKKW